MSSLFKLNQLSTRYETPPIKGVSLVALENQDKEIYALRQQLQTMKTLYKNTKVQKTDIPKSKNNTSNIPVSESEYSKQRVEKLMAVLAEREKQMRLQQQEANQQHAKTVGEWEKEKEAKQNALCEIAALHGQVEFLKTKVIANQSLINIQKDQLKESESLAEAWKSKYLEIYEKWSEHNQHINEFKNFEDKLSKMQSLCSSFGEFFGEKTLTESQEFEVNEMRMLASSEFSDIANSQPLST
ncbi:MAG TPA: hypothetical protein VGP47_05135 [Parachlamydiaceae bacterium]|nr:hypothetical protein [Parachlamydiaceae bacterium]